jgi:hypothetical protein
VPLNVSAINRDAPAERVCAVSQAVYGAMTDIANFPVNPISALASDVARLAEGHPSKEAFASSALKRQLSP